MTGMCEFRASRWPNTGEISHESYGSFLMGGVCQLKSPKQLISHVLVLQFPSQSDSSRQGFLPSIEGGIGPSPWLFLDGCYIIIPKTQAHGRQTQRNEYDIVFNKKECLLTLEGRNGDVRAVQCRVTVPLCLRDTILAANERYELWGMT